MPLRLRISILALTLFVPGIVWAYSDSTTHPALTQEIVDYYNSHSGTPLTSEEREWIIQGSELEDMAPRWINHFYDPIYDSGWTGEGAGDIPQSIVGLFSKIGLSSADAVSAVAWLESFEIQQKYAPYGGNRSWKRGLEDFAKGDLKEAYITLGHTLHLLEDMSVPDHTRNDTHAQAVGGITGDTGSPYEDYASRWNRGNIKQLGIAESLKGRAPTSFNNSEDYLKSLASYSNKYFYSKDTIAKYENPKVIQEINEYAYGLDENNTKYPLARVTDVVNDDKSKSKLYVLGEDETILKEYFSRLSKQAVLHGAGMIQLFIKEAEDAKVNQAFYGRRSIEVFAFTKFLIIPTFSGIGIFDQVKRTTNSYISRLLPTARNTLSSLLPFLRRASDIQEPVVENLSSAPEEPALEAPASLPGPEAPPTNEPSDEGMVVSEVEGEFIAGEMTKVSRVLSGDSVQLASGEIVRYIGIDAPFPGNPEPECMSAEAKKLNEQLVLGKDVMLERGSTDKDEAGRLLRYVWVGTEHVNYRILRSGLASEHSSMAHEYADEFKKAESEAIRDKLGIWSGACTETQKLAEIASAQCSYQTNQTPGRTGVILNEIAWMGSILSPDDEWVELKNITNVAVEVGGWLLVDKDEQIRAKFKEGATIPSGGIHLLERTRDDTVPGIRADMIYAGGISNYEEGLRLFDKNCVLMDEVQAAPVWPAGDLSGRRTMERKADLTWQTYGGESPQGIFGTPKRENSPGLEAEAVRSAGAAPAVLVISEIQTQSAAGASDEFIELYNPSDSPVNISEWSIQYKSGSSTSGTVSKFNIPADSYVPGKGFFLIAKSGYTGTRTPDSTYNTQISLSSASTGATVYLVRSNSEITGDEDSDIADKIGYGAGSTLHPEGAAAPVPAIGQSLERKAEGCLAPSGTGEWSGNGCDSGDNSADLVLRTGPNPQNAASLPEPRSAPVVSSFAAQFISSSMQIGLNWDASDALHSASGINYVLKLTGSSTGVIAETGSTSHSFGIFDLGRSYDFELTATDRDGLPSTASATITPKLLENISFYPGAANHTLELEYASPDFIPDAAGPGGKPWQAMVFYLNREPNASNTILTTSGGHSPADAEGVLTILRGSCGGGSLGPSNAYVFATSPENCGGGGGLKSEASHPLGTEDGRAYIWTAAGPGDLALGPSDYVTIAFYDFSDSGAGMQHLALVARDLTRYHYLPSRPSVEPPSMPGEPVFGLDDSAMNLNISWAGSTDADSPDASLTYEVAAAPSALTESDWVPVGTALNRTIPVIHPERYNIAVRARDEQGNLSAVREAAWEFPAGFVMMPRFLDYSLRIDGLPRGQRILLPTETTLEGVILRVGMDSIQSKTFVTLHADSENAPGEILATSAELILTYFEAANERFYDLPPTTLPPGYYWIFVRSVEGYEVYQPYTAGGPDGYPDGAIFNDPTKDLYFRLVRQ